MTLNVTSSAIQIKNSAGVVKFDSTNKLVFLRSAKIGRTTVYQSEVIVPFTTLAPEEFLVLNIYIHSCTGTVGNQLAGIQLPANGTIITEYYGRAISTSAAADQDMLFCSLAGSNLVFKAVKCDYNNQLVPTTISTDFTYTARVYRYL